MTKTIKRMPISNIYNIYIQHRNQEYDEYRGEFHSLEGAIHQVEQIKEIHKLPAYILHTKTERIDIE